MLPILILALASAGLCLILISIPYFFAPKDKNSAVKADAYECGLIPEQKADQPIPVKFFFDCYLIYPF